MVFNTHCSIDHLNQMQTMIGKLPHRLIKDSSHKAYQEITSDDKLNLDKAKISRAQSKPLRAYFNLDNVDLVRRILRWEAKDRITADSILRHTYFEINKPIQQQHLFDNVVNDEMKSQLQQQQQQPQQQGAHYTQQQQQQLLSAQRQAQAHAQQQ